MSAARLNALCAVELDVVRRADRLADLRLAAAVALAPTVTTCEALLGGAEVPARRLDRVLTGELALEGDVALDHELALRVAGRGPRI